MKVYLIAILVTTCSYSFNNECDETSQEEQSYILEYDNTVGDLSIGIDSNVTNVEFDIFYSTEKSNIAAKIDNGILKWIYYSNEQYNLPIHLEESQKLFKEELEFTFIDLRLDLFDKKMVEKLESEYAYVIDYLIDIIKSFKEQYPSKYDDFF